MNENPNIVGEPVACLTVPVPVPVPEPGIPRIRRLKDLPVEERPRERLFQRGPGTLTDAELVGLLFGTGVRGLTAVDLGRDALVRAGGLRGLERTTPGEIAGRKGIGAARAARLSAALELGRRLAAAPLARGVKIEGCDDVVSRYAPLLDGLDRERFYVLLLDAKGRLMRDHLVSEGTVGEATVYEREVFAPAVRESAYAVICVHNHPSGDPTPSTQDMVLTERLEAAGLTLGVPLLDHVVVGGGRGVSIASLMGGLSRGLTRRGGAGSIPPADSRWSGRVGEPNVSLQGRAPRERSPPLEPLVER